MRAVPATGVSCPQLLIYYLPQTPVVEVLCKNSRMPFDLTCALCSTCGCKPLCNRQRLQICFPFIFEGLWIPPLNSSSGGYGALGTHWKHTPLHFCTQRSGEMTVLNHVFERDQVNKKINIITLSSQSSLPFSLSAAGYREGGHFWDEGITDSKPQVSLQSFHLDTSFYLQASSHVVHHKPSNLNCI